MPATQYQKNVLLVAATCILLMAFLIIKPLLISILSGGILAFFFYPLYDWLVKRFREKTLFAQRAAGLGVIGIVILALLSPFIFLVIVLSRYMPLMHTVMTDYIPSAIPSLLTSLQATLHKPDLSVYNSFIMSNVTLIVDYLTQILISWVRELVTGIPAFLFGSFVSLYIAYYLIRNAEGVYQFIQETIPLPKGQLAKIIHGFNALGRGVILSQLVIALIQAVLMLSACFIIRFPHALFVSMLTFLLAIIPFIGAIVVWVCLVLYLLANGSAGIPLWQPVFIFIYSTLFVSTVDNFVRPKMLADAAKINPAIVLIGFIGGFLLFGLPGILLGPIILTLVELAFDIYKQVNA